MFSEANERLNWGGNVRICLEASTAAGQSWWWTPAEPDVLLGWGMWTSVTSLCTMKHNCTPNAWKIHPLTAGLLSPHFQAFSKIRKHCIFGNHSFRSGVPVEGLFGSAYLHDVLSELSPSICVRSEWSQVSVLHWIRHSSWMQSFPSQTFTLLSPFLLYHVRPCSNWDI